MGNINTILLIDEDEKSKKYFVEKLREKVNFSYAKIEALFQALKEVTEHKSFDQNKELYLDFLHTFLGKLAKKQYISLIDIDRLSIENAYTLLKTHSNIMIIFLKKITNEDHVIQINGNNREEIDSLVDKLVDGGDIIWKV